MLYFQYHSTYVFKTEKTFNHSIRHGNVENMRWHRKCLWVLTCQCCQSFWSLVLQQTLHTTRRVIAYSAPAFLPESVGCQIRQTFSRCIQHTVVTHKLHGCQRTVTVQTSSSGEWYYPVVKVDYETRRYSRLLKNRGARLLNMGLEKSQTHSYPAHTANKCCMSLSVILFLYIYRPIVSGKMSHLASTFTFSSWICVLHTSLLIIVAGTLRRPAGLLTRSAATPYRLVPAHFYHWYYPSARTENKYY